MAELVKLFSAIRRGLGGVVVGAWLGVVTVPGAVAQVAEISFTQDDGGHIIFPASIAGVEGLVILDNGVPSTIFDMHIAAEQDLVSDGFLSRLNKMALGRNRGEAVGLRINDLEIEVTPDLMDMDALAGGMSDSRPLIGIVGAEIFREYVVTIDFDSDVVAFHERENFEPPIGVEPVRVNNMSNSGKLILPLSVEGRWPVRALLDLGMGGSLSLAPRSRPDAWLENRPSIPIEVRTVRGEGFGIRKGQRYTAERIKLGGHEIDEVSVSVIESGLLNAFPAIVGMQVWSQFNMTIDMAGEKIWLEPNGGFGEPIGRRPVIGIVTPLANSAERGALDVMFVNEDGPAGRAGLVEGDVIAKINGEEAWPTVLGRISDGDDVVFELSDGREISFTAEYLY